MVRCKRARNQLKSKQKYRITNWRAYNEALRERGSLTVWMSDEAVRDWNKRMTMTVGRPTTYSDSAIAMLLTIGKVFHQPLRQTQGLARSILTLMGINLSIPDFSTLSRRSKTLTVTLPRLSKTEGVVLIVDSTGLKVYGEGEWKVKKHGTNIHRTWQKLHIAVDTDGEIRATMLTPSHTTDDAVVNDLLNQEPDPVTAFIGDGAYDRRSVYVACTQHSINNVIVPPRKDAILWQRKRDRGPPPQRDSHVKRIWETSREQWKEETGYHRRSRGENTFHRFRKCFGGNLSSRRTETQITEAAIMCAALNRMTSLGMPKSIAMA